MDNRAQQQNPTDTVQAQRIGHQGIVEGLKAVDHRINALQQACSYLPRVEPDGSSECPFAEKLYAKKEKAYDELLADIPRLREWRARADDEIARCRRNLAQLIGAAGKLVLDESSRRYSEAEEAQVAEFGLWKSCRHSITETTARATEALGRAVRRRFPGKEPEETFAPMMLRADSFPPDGAAGRPGDLGTAGPGLSPEVGDLISLGPLARGTGGDA